MAEVDPIAADEAYRKVRDRRHAFLNALAPGNERDAARLERELAAAYIGDLLEQANTSSPLIGGAELEPVRRFDSDMRAAWVPGH
jgi:hypothetical protein